MRTITIPQKEYEALVETRLRHEQIRQALKEDVFSSPPTRNRKAVAAAFKAAGKYSPQFLRSLAEGLKRSTYFKGTVAE